MVSDAGLGMDTGSRVRIRSKEGKAMFMGAEGQGGRAGQVSDRAFRLIEV